MLYTNSRAFHIVPKRAFSAEALADFSGLIKEHVPRASAKDHSNLKVAFGLVIIIAVILITFALRNIRN